VNDHTTDERIARRLAEARLLFDADRLTLARRLRGMRKNQLAQAVGTTPTAIGQYEAGVHRPSEKTLSRLAFALGVPVEFFRAGRSPVSLDTAHFRSLRPLPTAGSRPTSSPPWKSSSSCRARSCPNDQCHRRRSRGTVRSRPPGWHGSRWSATPVPSRTSYGCWRSTA
jgi:transcriptional regulator with XRE-family HTH domain